MRVTPRPGSRAAGPTIGSSRPFSVETNLRTVDATDRIKRAIDTHASIELKGASAHPRLVAGHLRNGIVRLHLTQPYGDVVLRRGSRGFSLSFDGMIAPTPGGSELKGSFTISGASFIRAFLWLFRLGLIAFVLWGVTLAIRDDAPQAGARLGALVLVAVVMAAASLIVRRVGEPSVTDDADALADFMRRILA
jgi:hypothetical protein